jgi:hypothetical protein
MITSQQLEFHRIKRGECTYFCDCRPGLISGNPNGIMTIDMTLFQSSGMNKDSHSGDHNQE